MNRTIVIEETIDALNARAASLMAEKAREAIAERGRFTLALSGGSTPRRPYELLTEQPGIDWSRVFLFWGDDRFVEHTNPYSNYTLVEETLLRRLPDLPESNVFPVPVDATNPTQGAQQYSETIRQFFGLKADELPRFDLALNGMGPDGHTASLFPHIPADSEPHQIARMTHAGLSPWVDRVTLTFGVFNQARCVIFLAAGAGKADTLKTVLEGEPNKEQWPSQGIHPEEGEVIWLIDRAIAGKLSP